MQRQYTDVMWFHNFLKLNTFLKAVAGAISAPFKVLNRNMGHEDAFIRNPGADYLDKKSG